MEENAAKKRDTVCQDKLMSKGRQLKLLARCLIK